MRKQFYCLGIFLCALLSTSFGQNWSLTGNSGTNASTNFLGTKDNKSLVFKTNNTEQLRITPGGQIGVGVTHPSQKLDVNGNVNINGNINIGGGFTLQMENHAILRLDSFHASTFTGNGIPTATTGSFNTGNGYQALHLNTSGNYNTANGYQALYSNTVGSSNVANGSNSLASNTSGRANTATGDYSLSSNIDGSQNVADGTIALYNNTSGAYNTGTGYEALYYNTTGNYNTAHGSFALTNSRASYNVGMGSYALFSNYTGWQNTAVGYYSLYNNYDSWGNTALGYTAGATYRNGYYNTFIGSQADAVRGDIYNGTALGNTTYVTAPNQVRIGNSFITSIGGYTNWTNISDGRVKKNVQENVPGLVFINKLKPVTYNLDLDAADKIVVPPSLKDKNGKLLTQQRSQTEINARIAKQKIVYTGFVAQDVEKAAKELNYDFSGVDAAKNDQDLYGLRYTDFVMPLVKAVQELSQRNDEMNSEIGHLKSEIAELKSHVFPGNPSTLTGASLEQNIPNPFTQSTAINYTLPQQYKLAKIIVTDKSGKALKEVNISGIGKNTVTVDASALSAGSYQYSLYVDGKLISTKQMIQSR